MVPGWFFQSSADPEVPRTSPGVTVDFWGSQLTGGSLTPSHASQKLSLVLNIGSAAAFKDSFAVLGQAATAFSWTMLAVVRHHIKGPSLVLNITGRWATQDTAGRCQEHPGCPQDCGPAGLVQVSKQPKYPKVLRESAKGVFLGLLSESPKTVSCTVRNCVLGCFARCETGFERCERLFCDSRPRETKSLLALSFKHFWAFWLF